ncbi:MAG: hypothetical protein CMM52_13265 [Rhodospirillaceae bacterium]|nr:hypothetical protein [Rhodospirillaceae bacterium]|tara:strand:- start:693 stop:1178 length:486 start_codon:yes stop_codon:yes gene_type:complete
MKSLFPLGAIFVFLAFSPVAGNAAEETEEQLKARQKAEAEANRVHALSVFSYVNPVRGRIHSRRRPILITLNVKGIKALSKFCHQKPLIGETILKVIGWGPAPDLSNKKILAEKQRDLREAFDAVLPENSLKTVSLKVGRMASEFGDDLKLTAKACSVGKG